MTGAPLAASTLSLDLLRRGKVREVYGVDDETLLLVASDRVSAFDVVLEPPIPDKGAVLTQLSAWWFVALERLLPHHCLTADADEIIARVPEVAGERDQLVGRAMLCRRTSPLPVECVVRGYLSGSAWAEYQRSGTLAGEPLPGGLVESARLEPPIFSPATKAEEGHDENITFAQMGQIVGTRLAERLREASLRLYGEGRDRAAARGIIIADTKFEFGEASDGTLLLIDEVLTPDSSRFWPADGYVPGRSQPSFDKQPIRDHLAAERKAGRWNGEPPAPRLPDDVVRAARARYREAYRRITGEELDTP